MSIKILLDTDIGSDIDDAVCLAYLLAQPECELVGITTVTGEAHKRAMMASALCNVAGRSVAIFPGAEVPLLISQQQPYAPQAAGLARWDHETAFPHGQAVAFMRQTVREHPGDVVLLTIGPLTNVARLFSADTEIPSLLRGLVMMCGVFTNRLPGVGPLEWNAKLDPHATAIVYGAVTRVHRSIGLDVTFRVTMSAAEVRERFHADLLRPVLDFAEVWFQSADKITFHDPLAAVSIFSEGICSFERGTVEVEVADPNLQGFTRWRPGGPSDRHEVALTVNPGQFFEHFFSIIGGKVQLENPVRA